MKTLNETFTDQEYEQLKQAKDKLGLNWHDFIFGNHLSLLQWKDVEQTLKEQKVKDVAEEAKTK